MGHWLGTGKLAGGKLAFLQFQKALLRARALKLKGMKEWRGWSKNGARPANVPSCPDVIYKHDGWQGCGHWLGAGNVGVKRHQFLPFKKALPCARSLMLKNKQEWQAWCKKPANTMGGKGTGWARATLLPNARSSCRSRRRCCAHAPSS